MNSASYFEHRLFLSATPHNGHSNSFSALLEILDPQRFVRGVTVRKGDLAAIMVRRLKEDIRAVQGGFAERRVVEISIKDLPQDAPELVLARKLALLRDMREARLTSANRSAQNAAILVLSHLQQRLLSSIDAFAHTIRVHRQALERAAANAPTPSSAPAQTLFQPSSLEDETSDEDQDNSTAVRDKAVADATLFAAANPTTDVGAEFALVQEMEEIADTHRDRPDGRINWLIDWIEKEMCPGLRAGGHAWSGTRLLIFTEWEATRRYIERKLRAAIAHTDQADARIDFYTGDVQSARRREELKRSFNMPPDEHPLRILIATDAAREGINLQRHCHDLVHFDLPWNPSRLEQRNGRIDRKLQRAPFVTCRYFLFTQRPEDRVLDALVRKSETIRQQLGSMAQVLEARTATMLSRGIRQHDADRLATEIATLSDGEREAAIREELEATRERQQDLQQQIDRLRQQIFRSEDVVGLSPDRLRQAVSVSLRLANAPAIKAEAEADKNRPATYNFPADASALAGDPSWATALDLLRQPRDRGETIADWRVRAKIRPITFDDPDDLADKAVQLHLEHRIVQRLLARFHQPGPAASRSQSRLPRQYRRWRCAHHSTWSAVTVRPGCRAAARGNHPRHSALERTVTSPRTAAALWRCRRRANIGTTGSSARCTCASSCRRDQGPPARWPDPRRDRLAASRRTARCRSPSPCGKAARRARQPRVPPPCGTCCMNSAVVSWIGNAGLRTRASSTSASTTRNGANWRTTGAPGTAGSAASIPDSIPSRAVSRKATVANE